MVCLLYLSLRVIANGLEFRGFRYQLELYVNVLHLFEEIKKQEYDTWHMKCIFLSFSTILEFTTETKNDGHDPAASSLRFPNAVP